MGMRDKDVKGPAELGTRSHGSSVHTIAKLITQIHSQCNVFPAYSFIHSTNGTGDKLAEATELLMHHSDRVQPRAL